MPIPHEWLRRRPKMAKALLLLALLPAVTLSQGLFSAGIPQLVFDAAQAAHVIAEIAQLQALYNLTAEIYNQIAYNAGWTPVRASWLGASTKVVLSQTGTVFGETAGWNPAVTGGVGIPGAWGSATYGINPPPFYGSLSIGGSSLSAAIASIKVADGMSQAAMQTIANSRTNQPINDLAVFSLEQFAQDTTMNTNSEVEQLNQIASSAVLANRQTENTNALLTTIAEQQLLMNKSTRDTLADNLNINSIRDTYVVTTGTAWGGDAALFQSYRQ